MSTVLNYLFEIFPTEEQSNTLHRWIDICRLQYNSALLDKERYYGRTGKGYTKAQLQKQLTLDKKNHP
ncbi:helix-turn-helix domain-containing protein, partial [Guptibacillus spartinae]|uniref:helix-turn-helix domain-containing protein n=1 Tax=Guptibacillus spartinae TaxID=3025679 RepID=UPI0023617053